jgi:Holliday junction resolvase RusA-like endonuclease
MSTTFRVPLLPPSVNHYKKPNGKRGYYVTAEAKAFIDAVAMLAPRDVRYGTARLAVTVSFGIREKRILSGDVDNLAKVSLDALRHCSLIEDDRYIVRLNLQKMPVETCREEYTHYEICGC